jgi:hypothetical protein
MNVKVTVSHPEWDDDSAECFVDWLEDQLKSYYVDKAASKQPKVSKVQVE